MTETSPGRPTRIVILGGGFAGVYTARKLERLLGRRTDVEISLVNRDNYFVFQPLIPEIVSGNVDGQQEVLARLQSGEMFGELALLNQPTRMASIRCATALDVIVIRRSEFGVLASNLTSFRENIDQLAAERMQSPTPRNGGES